MKNNTKVRLHLSKALFENIVKEVVSESKKMNMSGGAYTESVKMPKKAKKMEEVNAVADTDKMKRMEGNVPTSTSTTSVQDMNAAGYGDKPAIPGLREKEIKEVDAVTDSERMRKMHEMSSKDKMAKGLYKEDALELLKQYKTGMKLQKKGKPDETFTIQMVKPTNVKGMEAAHALYLKNDKTGQEFTDSPGHYEIVESMREDEMGSSDKYPVGTVLFKPKGNQTITVKRVEGDKIFVVSDLTPNREFQWNADVIDDGIRTKEFQLKSSDQNEMQINVAEDGDTLQPGDNITWLDGHQKENKGVVQSQEGGDYYKVKVTAAPIGGGAKVGDVITKQSGDVKKAMGEMQINVAEEGQMNEMTDAVSWEAVAAGMTAIGLAPLAIDKLHQWWKKKHPESFKKAQDISAAMDRQAGNTPGQGHGVDPSKTFGPQNESDPINELMTDREHCEWCKKNNFDHPDCKRKESYYRNQGWINEGKKVMPKLNELRKQIKNK